MKKARFTILSLVLSVSLFQSYASAARLEDYLDRKEIQEKIRETIADQDINFNVDLGNIDLIDGINVSNKYRYDVEASYINKFYTRIDKWDINAGINVGTILKELVDVPFGFSVNRSNSFFFVRQFPTKLEAMKAIPYAPNKLPLNAKLALKNLRPGDFVSMPANMNIAVGAGVSTSVAGAVGVSAGANVSFVLSGEFTIQVFKLDDTHVRLKLLTKRGRDSAASANVGASFNIFGIRLLDRQIERLVDRDLAQFGYSYNPGAQFIIDYVFNLKDPAAQEAYNQIMSSTVKFKDIIVADMVNPKDLKDKLISSYEKADDLFYMDQQMPPKERRVQRIFKGFSSYGGHTRHIKLGLLVTSYTKDRTFTESRVTFIDKKEKDLQFYYPTYSKYIEAKFGKKFFQLKDQSYQNNFGLIPRFKSEDSTLKNGDLGLTFERKDRYFTSYEQKAVEKFMLSQIPTSMARNIDFSQWKDGSKKMDSRIFFQLILKAQGFEYLKNYPVEELRKKIIIYVNEKRKLHVIERTDDDNAAEELKSFLLLDHWIEKERLLSLANKIAVTLAKSNTEEMIKDFISLSEGGVFDKIGVGFLISLLPQDKLEDLVYLKLDMIGKDLTPINTEVGKLNWRALYKELNEVQARLSNRGYDLRLSDEDRNMEDLDIDNL